MTNDPSDKLSFAFTLAGIFAAFVCLGWILSYIPGHIMTGFYDCRIVDVIDGTPCASVRRLYIKDFVGFCALVSFGLSVFLPLLMLWRRRPSNTTDILNEQ